MALCIACGNSIGNTTRCSKCGGDQLRAVDRVVIGTAVIDDRRSVPSGWDEDAATLDVSPSKQSLREVRREARRRQRRRTQPSDRQHRREKIEPEYSPRCEAQPDSHKRWLPWVIVLGIAFGLRWLQSGALTGIGTPAATAAPASTFVTVTPMDAGSNLAPVVAFILVLAALYTGLAALVATSASRKGRSAWAWFFLAWLFPVVSWIIVATMAPSPEAIAMRSLRTGHARRCTQCREIIQIDAQVCRYCGARSR